MLQALASDPRLINCAMAVMATVSIYLAQRAQSYDVWAGANRHSIDIVISSKSLVIVTDRGQRKTLRAPFDLSARLGQIRRNPNLDMYQIPVSS